MRSDTVAGKWPQGEHNNPQKDILRWLHDKPFLFKFTAIWIISAAS